MRELFLTVGCLVTMVEMKDSPEQHHLALHWHEPW